MHIAGIRGLGALALFFALGCFPLIGTRGLGTAVRPLSPGQAELVVAGAADLNHTGALWAPWLEAHYAHGISDRVILDVHGGGAGLAPGVRFKLLDSDPSLWVLPQVGFMGSARTRDDWNLYLSPSARFILATRAGSHVSVGLALPLDVRRAHLSPVQASVSGGWAFDLAELQLRPEAGFVITPDREWSAFLGLALALRSAAE